MSFLPGISPDVSALVDLIVAEFFPTKLAISLNKDFGLEDDWEDVSDVT